MTLDKVQSKTGTIKSLLIKAWRERWSDVQWGIQIKTVLPRGCSGDAYNLSEILLSQALVGPAPNALVLGFLKHSLASQVVSHASVVLAVAKFDQFDKPHCTATLLDLVSAAREHVTSKGRPEDCVNLSVALLNLLLWLLKLTLTSFEKLEKLRDSKVHSANYRKALDLALFFTEQEFSLAMLFIGKAEEKETHAKVVSTCKQLTEQVKQGHLYDPDPAALKQSVAKLAAAIKNIDPSKSAAVATESLTQSIQPILAFEALLSPTSDLVALSHQLYAVAFSNGMTFSELVYQILHSSLLSISQTVSMDALKWDAFILIKLPILLEKLSVLMRVDVTQLRTPTDLYKAFDRMLKNESLLDSIDAKSKCNVVKLLLGVVGRTSSPLMTETEAVDVEKRRKSRSNVSAAVAAAADLLPEEILGGTRHIELTLKAEAMMDSILKTLDTDSSKPESMENLLGVLCHIIKGESFDLLLAASSANGKLKPFVRSMIKFNQQSQESQGESVKNSLLRAALFDITFLMMVHVVQSFGNEIVLQEAGGGGGTTLIETWVRDMMLEEGRFKQMQVNQSGANAENTMVDNLLQQLSSGDLRTQVVKWQNVCVNIHLAMKEMVVARSLETLDQESYSKMCQTSCSKLCALPICIVSWMMNFRVCVPESTFDLKALTAEFLEVANREEMHSSDMPHAKERMALMATIISKFQQHVGDRGRLTAAVGGRNFLLSPLKQSLSRVWSHVNSRGRLDIDSVWNLRELFNVGGAVWFTTALVEELLGVVYQDEIDKMADLLTAVFHINLDQCCLALLLHVLPGHIQYRNRVEQITDPHGAALAKVVISCVYAVLIPRQLAGKGGGGAEATRLLQQQAGSKRSAAAGDSPDLPSAKMRRMMAVSFVGSAAAEDKSEVDSPHPVVVATAGFLQLLQSVCQENSISPVTHFAVRFLDQAARRGRSKSRLILQHLNLHFVLHLVKIVPDMFSMSFVTQLLDAGSPAGRKSMARVMCLLRNIKRKKELLGKAES